MAEDMLVDLKKVVKTPKLVLGARRSLMAMKAGNAVTLYVAKNAPKFIVDDVDHFSKFVDTKIVKLDIASDEFGIVCKRQHTVTVAAILK